MSVALVTIRAAVRHDAVGGKAKRCCVCAGNRRIVWEGEADDLTADLSKFRRRFWDMRSLPGLGVNRGIARKDSCRSGGWVRRG